MIKKKKSILKPTKTIPFLGCIVKSIKMLLLLSEEKTAKLKSSALSLLENVPKAREILGSGPGSSASFADGSPPLQDFSEKVHSGIFSTSDKVDYKKLCLSKGEIMDLLWWTQGPAQANDRVIIPPKVVSLIFSNDSKIRWGTHLVEICIGGRWKELEALDQKN